MTEIKPFQATVYNINKINNINDVMCPPYDVISKKQQQHYYSQSDHNFIRVLLPKSKTGDDSNNNVYTRAKETFNQWLKEQILIKDEEPAIYYYRQEYKVMGTRHSRLGFISLMRIQDETGAKVYPHEKTHAAAKEDRLKLWKSLNAILSPIFVCFSDKDKKVEKIFIDHVSKTEPFLNIVDSDGVRHLVWCLREEEKINEIMKTMGSQSLFIADGHHRYEVAKELRRQKMAKTGKADSNAPHNFTLTYFTNMDSKDLQIFPMHRIIKTFPKDRTFLEEFFRIDKVKTKEELLVLLAKAGQNEHAFGLYLKEGMYLLRLKNKLLIDKVVTEGSPEFKRLDATILKYFIFDKIGVQSEDIVYTKDIGDVTGMVDEGQAAAGFVMNAVRIKQLKNIALNGEKMPPKTTYFYPKLLSGLAVHKL